MTIRPAAGTMERVSPQTASAQKAFLMVRLDEWRMENAPGREGPTDGVMAEGGIAIVVSRSGLTVSTTDLRPSGTDLVFRRKQLVIKGLKTVDFSRPFPI